MTVEERLERLEKENRRLKYLLFSLLFLVAGVFFMGATTKKVSSIPDEIKAHKFTLVDKDGEVRGEWNEGSLGLWDKGKNSLMILGCGDGGPLLGLYDKEKDSVVLNVVGGAADIICSQERKPRMILSTGKGEPTLTLFGEGGEGVIALGMGKDFGLSILKGREGVVLGLEKGPALTLLEEGGKRAVLSATEEGSGLGLFDKYQNMRVGLAAGKEGSTLTFSNEKGKQDVELVASKEGSILDLADEEGKRKAMLGVLNEEGCIGLYDNWGNLKFFK
jgi:hypothetical protein